MAARAAPDVHPEVIAALVAIASAVDPAIPVSAVLALMVLPKLLCQRSCIASLPIGNLLCAGEQALLVELRTLAVSPAHAADVAELSFA